MVARAGLVCVRVEAEFDTSGGCGLSGLARSVTVGDSTCMYVSSRIRVAARRRHRNFRCEKARHARRRVKFKTFVNCDGLLSLACENRRQELNCAHLSSLDDDSERTVFDGNICSHPKKQHPRQRVRQHSKTFHITR